MGTYLHRACHLCFMIDDPAVAYSRFNANCKDIKLLLSSRAIPPSCTLLSRHGHNAEFREKAKCKMISVTPSHLMPSHRSTRTTPSRERVPVTKPRLGWVRDIKTIVFKVYFYLWPLAIYFTVIYNYYFKFFQRSLGFANLLKRFIGVLPIYLYSAFHFV